MSITVDFTGICTHMLAMGGFHRVVLVRADNGANLNEHPLPPHIPLLKIPLDQIAGFDGGLDGLEPVRNGVWRLCGVQLTLDGVTEQTLTRLDSFADIPHLKTKDETPVPPTSEEVVMKEQAACYFDLSAGKLSSTKTQYGAIMSRLEVESGDEPALQVKCFWNQKTSTIRLRPGAAFEISHIGTQDGESEKDFLYHYRVFETVHPNAYVPPEPHKRAMSKAPGNISIGCSNSQYP